MSSRNNDDDAADNGAEINNPKSIPVSLAATDSKCEVVDKDGIEIEISEVKTTLASLNRLLKSKPELAKQLVDALKEA